MQNERLVLLTDQQDSLKNEVTILKRNREKQREKQDVTVSYVAALYSTIDTDAIAYRSRIESREKGKSGLETSMYIAIWSN